MNWRKNLQFDEQQTTLNLNKQKYRQRPKSATNSGSKSGSNVQLFSVFHEIAFYAYYYYYYHYHFTLSCLYRMDYYILFAENLWNISSSINPQSTYDHLK